MLYATIVRHHRQLNPQARPVSPALIFIQHANADDYDPTLAVNRQKIDDIKDLEEPFTDRLHALLDEIFNPDVPFTPTDDRKRCSHCPYRKICYY